MDDANPPRRPFHLADLFLLIVGFAVGFAMFSVIRAEAIRYSEMDPPFTDTRLSRAGPVELLATAFSFGIAAAFPLVRLREAWKYPDSRRFRVTDAMGLPPVLFFGTGTTYLVIGPVGNVAWLGIPIFVAFLLLLAAFLLWIPVAGWFLAGLPTPSNWIEYLALTSTLANGLVLLRAFS